VAVEAFLDGRAPFNAIPEAIERTLDAADNNVSAPASLADVRATDAWARRFSAETLRTLPSS
jgi:1-deoxy-D-xylulose-5-phosphate reductoisomerase